MSRTWKDRKKNPKSFNRLMSRHHLTPKSRGGSWSMDNILKLWRDRHDAWHLLFGNMTLSEIIVALTRIERMKERLRDKGDSHEMRLLW